MAVCRKPSVHNLALAYYDVLPSDDLLVPTGSQV